MAVTRSMTRKQNQDEGSRKRSKTCKNGGSASWSDLCHDVLFLLILKLGIVDFVAFKGVCKTWRSFAESNENMFMASRTPMTLSFSGGSKKKECQLKDIKGRMFKTVLPRSSNRTYVGLTCGYVILYGRRTHDFRLVNLITRKELHFPRYPFCVDTTTPGKVRAILVHSPSLSGWVLVLARRLSKVVSFSSSKESGWNHITSGFPIHDLHAFQGKIYALTTYIRLWEVRLNPKPTLTLLLDRRYLRNSNDLLSELVSWGERLFVVDYPSKNALGTHGIDFNQMKWVYAPQSTLSEHTLVFNKPEHGPASKLVIWDDIRTQYERFGFFIDSDKGKFKGKFFYTDMCYLPRDCLKENHLDE